jgi:hypothetical protein
MLNITHVHLLSELCSRATLRCALLLAAFTAVGCGGKTTGSQQEDDGSAPLDGSALDSARLDGTASDTASLDSGIPLPDPDSGQCDRADGVCVFCSDDEWHCGGHVAPQCPPGVAEGGQCAGVVVNAGDCVTCGSDGAGDDWECIGIMPKDGYWKPVPAQCSP